MQKFLLLLPMLFVVGCSTAKPGQQTTLQCHEPAVEVRTNRDLAEAVLELQSAIRLCNAINGEHNAR